MRQSRRTATAESQQGHQHQFYDMTYQAVVVSMLVDLLVTRTRSYSEDFLQMSMSHVLHNGPRPAGRNTGEVLSLKKEDRYEPRLLSTQS